MPQPVEPTRRISSTDGTELAVYESGKADGPTLVCVHGYPDNASVWAGITELLEDGYRVISYDVRGAGASGQPAGRGGYRLDQLQADFVAVLDAVGGDRPVHLLAHDWGSIQAWHWVTDPELARRLASLTSISGPSLEFAGRWLRRGLGSPRTALPALRQLAHSYYLAGFQVPLLPELLWRSGLLDRATATGAADYHRQLRDRLNGLQLYRANLRGRPARRVGAGRAEVPVQVLAPAQDAFVTQPLQLQAPADRVARLYLRPIAGGHWVVAERPDVIAAATRELVEAIEQGSESPALRRARVAATRSGAFAGQLVLITGAGNGIGRETALAFAAAGADLLLADIDEPSAMETAEQAGRLGVTASAYALDVADATAWEHVTAEIVRDHGVPDVLVNNAGIGMAGPFLSTSDADWDRIIDINLRSVITGCRVIAELMVARGHGGRIVNIASAGAYAQSKTNPVYGTTKAAVLTLTECLRAELAAESISVTAICPGFIDTDISATRTNAEAQAAEQARAVKSYHRRNYSPRRAAAEIVQATAAGTPVKYLPAEALGFLALDRSQPPPNERSPRSI